jgi:hypothetical protein
VRQTAVAVVAIGAGGEEAMDAASEFVSVTNEGGMLDQGDGGNDRGLTNSSVFVVQES